MLLLQQQPLLFLNSGVSLPPSIVSHNIVFGPSLTADALSGDYLIWFRFRTFDAIESPGVGYTDLGSTYLGSSINLSISICGQQVASDNTYANVYTAANAIHGYLVVRNGTFNFGDVATHSKITTATSANPISWAASAIPASLVIQIACARENQTDLACLLPTSSTLLRTHDASTNLDTRIAYKAGTTSAETKAASVASPSITAVLTWQ